LFQLRHTKGKRQKLLDVPDRHMAGWPQQKEMIEVVAGLTPLIIPVAGDLLIAFLGCIARRAAAGERQNPRQNKKQCKEFHGPRLPVLENHWCAPLKRVLTGRHFKSVQ